MSENEKCLSNESIEILFRIAEKGGALSYSRQDDFKVISSLVDSGHIFQGQLLNDSLGSISYSITKKGFLALQCNLLWNTYADVNAHQHVMAHINQSKLDCHQGCLLRKNTLVKEPIKMSIITEKSVFKHDGATEKKIAQQTSI